MSLTPPAIDAVLFDRDGTLVVDVPYNRDPELVHPLPTVRETLDRLRAAGVPIGVVTNQSGLARGFLSEVELAAVQLRVEELLGPFEVWRVCPHGPDEGCACRKPMPGMILSAAEALGVSPERIAMIGDIGADVEAAEAAGAVGVLVPTTATRPEEVERALLRARTLREAVELVLPGLPATQPGAPAARAVRKAERPRDRRSPGQAAKTEARP